MSQLNPPGVLPYASPLTGSPFRSAKGRGTVTISLLVASIAVSIIAAVVMFMQVKLLQDVKNGIPVTPARAQTNDITVLLVNGTNLLLLLATAIPFFMWLYRTVANLPALGERDRKFGPGRSIWNFFIPFANLVWGYQSVRQAWDKSSTDTFGVDNGGGIVRLWWGAWLITGFLAHIGSALERNTTLPGGDPNIDAMISMSWAFVASDLTQIVAGVVLIFIIRKIDAMQLMKSMNVGAAPAAYLAPSPAIYR